MTTSSRTTRTQTRMGLPSTDVPSPDHAARERSESTRMGLPDQRESGLYGEQWASCRSTNIVLGLESGQFVRQLAHWLVDTPTGGTYRDGRRWIWRTYEEWANEFGYWDWWELRNRVIPPSVTAGVVLKKRIRNKGLLYSINFQQLLTIIEAASLAPPKWLIDAVYDPKLTPAIQTSLPLEPVGDEDSVETESDMSDREAHSVQTESGTNEQTESGTNEQTESGTNLTFRENKQRKQAEKELASSDSHNRISGASSDERPPDVLASEFVTGCAAWLQVTPDGAETRTIRKIAHDRGAPINPAWVDDLKRTIENEWSNPENLIAVATHELKVLIEREQTGEVNLSERPDWAVWPYTPEEKAEYNQQMLEQQEEWAAERQAEGKRRREEQAMVAEQERREREEREEQDAAMVAEQERREREEREEQDMAEEERLVEDIVERMEAAGDSRRRLSDYYYAQEHEPDWLKVLNNVGNSLSVESVLANPDVVDVFGAVGLGLDGSAYQIAFTSNLGRQVVEKSEPMRSFVLEAVREAGIDAGEIVTIHPPWGWQRENGSEPIC